MTSQSLPESADFQSFDAIEAYDWDSDREFQTGLQSILSSVPSPTAEQKEELTLRAKCFFYSKMSSIKIDYNAYKAYISQRKPNPATATTATTPAIPENPPEFVQKEHRNSDAPYPMSFAHIVELITKGLPIPGIKQIPNELNSAPPSQPVRAKRLKPWEKAGSGNASPGTGAAVGSGGGSGGGGGEQMQA
ncbi:hypothetical protein L873DRAFT_1681587 [Choiromyces venosus 120613-1]|uniref:Uncharacterized protein n=1 Tax=Choiromyces venosus 120613-1 TaxID=1336337 RepID=A0A3N4JP02_9PEZI|nr:hypothetical protein L873DRAFT_1681587 [Choiromyces venosus 120613-1]